MQRRKFVSVLLAASALATADHALAGSPDEKLVSEIKAADIKFFSLLFEVCDPSAMSKMLTSDFEMYHDRAGVVSKGPQAFLENYSKDCADWTSKDAVRARRVLVEDSLSVFPVPGYGAIEDGVHDFYVRIGQSAEKAEGRGRFTQLWRQEADGWRLARVFSYDHVDAK